MPKEITPTTASPGRGISQYVPVDLRSFPAGRPPLLDLYHHVRGQYVLYCEAQAIFAESARRRLLDHDVDRLYIRITDGKVAAGELDLPDLLALPDDQLPPLIKAGLLYNSAVSTARMILAAPGTPENPNAAQELVGTIAVRLTRDPGAFSALVQLMSHDFSVYTHSVNVCTYATAMGSRLGLDRDDLLALSLGAFLHDVGKTRIPKAILEKPEALTAEEWDMVRRHPEWGAQLMGEMTLKQPRVRAIVLQHHERLDSSGYPQGLTGSDIHLLARLVSIVDVYDALTGERPYRPPLSPFDALSVIGAEVPERLDHDLFVVFVQMLGQEGG